MAVNILMMCGRFGGVVGSNVTSMLLYDHCEYAFYLPGCLFAGEFFVLSNARLIVRKSGEGAWFIVLTIRRECSCHFIAAAAFLVYLIPYNEKAKNDARSGAQPNH